MGGWDDRPHTVLFLQPLQPAQSAGQLVEFIITNIGVNRLMIQLCGNTGGVWTGHTADECLSVMWCCDDDKLKYWDYH